VKTFTFKDLNTAKQKFKEIFKEITANDWDNVKYNKLNFKTDYKKYYIFDYTYEEENAIYEYLKITIKNLYIKQKSEYGDKKLKNLIYYLLVKSYQNKFSIDDSTLDVEQNTKNILERYKSTAIIKAVTILSDLKKLLTNSSNQNDEIYLRKRNYLINSYNDLIPFSKKINNFNEFSNNIKIDEEISRLTNYYYIENVLKIFLGAIYNLNTIHPLDYIIKVLDCKIEALPKPNKSTSQLTTESDYVYNYIYSTNQGNTPITAVYKITETINDKNFNLNKYDNRYLFFHGTKVENVIGILSQGLKIAPVQAINTGKSYGNGIYLSDSFSCSLGYCYHRINMVNNKLNFDEKIFMFLAEVAVGNVGMNADTNIVRMTMNFDDYYTLDDGCRIFKNLNKINYGFGIIVAHEETNVRIKYLIEIN
jgi:poly [ADP-ribose] polymerase